MVGPRELPNAVALNSGLFNGSRVIGPAIAGVVIATVGTGLCFVLNAVSFLAVLTALAIVRQEELRPIVRDPSTRVIEGLRRGFAYAWNDPQLRLILDGRDRRRDRRLQLPRPRPAARRRHASRRTGGLRPPVRLVRARRARRRARDGHLPRGELAPLRRRHGVVRRPAFSFSPPSTTPYLAGTLLFGIGIAFTLFTANANALVQLAAPDHLRGRLIGLYLFAFLGLAPVGGLFAGWLAQVGGTTLAFAVAGVVSLATIGARERQPLTPP